MQQGRDGRPSTKFEAGRVADEADLNFDPRGVERAIDGFLASYAFEGVGGLHVPGEFEASVIKDAIMNLCGDEAFGIALSADTGSDPPDKSVTAGLGQRSFALLSETWYGPTTLQGSPGICDEVVIMNAAELGEFFIRWSDKVQVDGARAPYLHALSNSWSYLANTHDIIVGLAMLAANGFQPQPPAVVKMLLSLGLVDVTERERRGQRHQPPVAG